MEYLWKCPECEIYVRVNRRIADRDVPPTKEECEDCLCDSESSDWHRVFESPMVMRVSYHDGKDRGDDWNRLKEANRLERESLRLPHDKRGEHRKEIKKLRSTD